MTELGLMPTEQINPDTRNIDQSSTLVILEMINAQDALVHQAVQQALPQIAVVVERIAKGFVEGGRLLYFGAGTSGRLGVLDASECLPTFGAQPAQVQGIIAGGELALRHAVEGAEDDALQGYQDALVCQLTSSDVVVGISASGYAPYVHGVIKAAKEAGAFSSCLVCNAQSDLIQRTEGPIVVSVGPEVIAGSTRMKAGTAQKMVLNMLSTAAMVQIGKTYENLMVDVQPSNDKLKARAARIVASLANVNAEQAKSALEKTDYQVKPAVIMLIKQCSLQEASQQLQRHQGKLRAVLGGTAKTG